eukprot:scaffold992_cov175-Amphora_coffeaeformis.AAC.3
MSSSMKPLGHFRSNVDLLRRLILVLPSSSTTSIPGRAEKFAQLGLLCRDDDGIEVSDFGHKIFECGRENQAVYLSHAKYACKEDQYCYGSAPCDLSFPPITVMSTFKEERNNDCFKTTNILVEDDLKEKNTDERDYSDTVLGSHSAHYQASWTLYKQSSTTTCEDSDPSLVEISCKSGGLITATEIDSSINCTTISSDTLACGGEGILGDPTVTYTCEGDSSEKSQTTLRYGEAYLECNDVAYHLIQIGLLCDGEYSHEDYFWECPDGQITIDQSNGVTCFESTPCGSDAKCSGIVPLVSMGSSSNAFNCMTVTAFSDAPSKMPSMRPSSMPSDFPSRVPSSRPSASPTLIPSNIPSDLPSHVPSDFPSRVPSSRSSASPTPIPSNIPCDPPSLVPSDFPIMVPSFKPSAPPTLVPSNIPSDLPSLVPTLYPTRFISPYPTFLPTSSPSAALSGSPNQTRQPSTVSSGLPTGTKKPSSGQTSSPSDTSSESLTFTKQPSSLPSSFLSQTPSESHTETHKPSGVPSKHPSMYPSTMPSKASSVSISSLPTGHQVDDKSVPSDSPPRLSDLGSGHSDAPTVSATVNRSIIVEDISPLALARDESENRTRTFTVAVLLVTGIGIAAMALSSHRSSMR